MRLDPIAVGIKFNIRATKYGFNMQSACEQLSKPKVLM